jgi:HEPN domain-containing protein
MPQSKSQEIRRFLRVAIQRFDDASFLSEQGQRHTAAVYLAGYTIECSLKVLLLSCIPERQCQGVMESFRGKEGHSFEALKAKYTRKSGKVFPPAISKALSFVGHWTTDLRYEPGDISPDEAEKFLRSAEVILGWIKESL